MPKLSSIRILIPTILSLFVTLLYGAESGSIQGRVVVEKTKLPPKNVKVSVPNLSTEVDADGTYTLSPLPPGKYDVTVQWPELGTQVKPGVEVATSDGVLLNFSFLLPSPKLLQVFPPVISRPRSVTITGESFLHASQAAYEVRIGGKAVPAIRKDNATIEIKEETVGVLLRASLGGKSSLVELPVSVVINGVASNEGRIGFYNASPGTMSGKIVTSNPEIKIEGARLFLVNPPIPLAVNPNGIFSSPKLPPRHYTLQFSWPGLGIHEERSINVFPGETSPIEFKVKIPSPQLTSLTPDHIEKPETIIVRGNYFLHSFKVPYQVTLNGKAIKADRISNQVIQIPETEIAMFLKDVKPGSQHEWELVVMAAKTQSEARKLTFKGKSAPPLLSPEPIAANPPLLSPKPIAANPPGEAPRDSASPAVQTSSATDAKRASDTGNQKVESSQTRLPANAEQAPKSDSGPNATQSPKLNAGPNATQSPKPTPSPHANENPKPTLSPNPASKTKAP